MGVCVIVCLHPEVSGERGSREAMRVGVSVGVRAAVRTGVHIGTGQEGAIGPQISGHSMQELD